LSHPQSAALAAQKRVSWWFHVGSAVLGMILWSMLMSMSAALNVMHWENEHLRGAIIMVFAFGALPAVPVTILAMGLSARWLPRNGQRFALAFLLLATLTIGCTALLFSQIYRLMYVEWHADSFSRIWFWQFVFTTASAFYQFAVLGMRLYFPLGFAALLTFSLWFVRPSGRTAL